jgi:predicted RNA-binding Zn ribbon-like protein
MEESEDALAVRFANTRYAERGEPRDAILTTRALRDWLVACGLPGSITHEDVVVFGELRECVRRLMGSIVTGRRPDPRDVDRLNEAAAYAPLWPELVAADSGLEVRERSTAAPRERALAALARSTAEVVTAPRRARLRACEAPGCVQFFEENARHRSWCSAGCGNRARVARHYERSRAAPAG